VLEKHFTITHFKLYVNVIVDIDGWKMSSYVKTLMNVKSRVFVLRFASTLVVDINVIVILATLFRGTTSVGPMVNKRGCTMQTVGISVD
jgi:hypothetical protein